jgi:putative membrane protein
MIHPRIGMNILSVSAAALLLGAMALAQSQQDKTFVKTAMEVNIGEMRIGQLAAKKGGSEGVRKFGERTVADHTRLENEIKPVAEKIGVALPTELATDDQALLTKLEGESGAEFDDTYIHAMVEGHREAVQAYKTEEADGQDAAVKNAATHGEQVVAEHLKLAEQLQSTMAKN